MAKPFDCPNCGEAIGRTYERGVGKWEHGTWFCDQCEEEFHEEEHSDAE